MNLPRCITATCGLMNRTVEVQQLRLFEPRVDDAVAVLRNEAAMASLLPDLPG